MIKNHLEASCKIKYIYCSLCRLSHNHVRLKLPQTEWNETSFWHYVMLIRGQLMTKRTCIDFTAHKSYNLIVIVFIGFSEVDLDTAIRDNS